MSPSAVLQSTVCDLPITFPSKPDGHVTASTSTLELDKGEQTSHVLRTFRCLIADLCEQFNGGHPG